MCKNIAERCFRYQILFYKRYLPILPFLVYTLSNTSPIDPSRVLSLLHTPWLYLKRILNSVLINDRNDTWLRFDYNRYYKLSIGFKPIMKTAVHISLSNIFDWETLISAKSLYTLIDIRLFKSSSSHEFLFNWNTSLNFSPSGMTNSLAHSLNHFWKSSLHFSSDSAEIVYEKEENFENLSPVKLISCENNLILDLLILFI